MMTGLGHFGGIAQRAGVATLQPRLETIGVEHVTARKVAHAFPALQWLETDYTLDVQIFHLVIVIVVVPVMVMIGSITSGFGIRSNGTRPECQSVACIVFDIVVLVVVGHIVRRSVKAGGVHPSLMMMIHTTSEE